MSNRNIAFSVFSAVFVITFVGFLNSCAAGKAALAPGGEVSSVAPSSDSMGKKESAEETEETPSPSPTVEPSVAPEPKKSKALDFALAERASPEAAGRVGIPAPSSRKAPAASGLKAGFSDDNAQFNFFLRFLEEFERVPNYALDIGERITLKFSDSDGRPVPNARVRVRAGTRVLENGRTYADGTFRLYPLVYNTSASSLGVSVESPSGNAELVVDRDGPRLVEASLARPRVVPDPLPLDVLFVLDTTGSMGEEIERLRDTIEIVHANISAMTPKPAVRFGMVLYKDREDEYDTEVVPFTSDLRTFQDELAKVTASGGGDNPEDLQAALEGAVKKMDWNDNGLRIAFVVTDAEPHLDYGQTYTYVQAARDAKALAIRMHTIGTGGLGVEGEYVLRQLSQYTEGKYIFLTYGETGESSGGAPGSVSHHSGSNFQTDKLEAIVIRFVKEDLARLSDVPLETQEDYFEANKIEDEEREATLDKLFGEALANLVDYSSFRVGSDTPCALLPIVPAEQDLASDAEYFGERMLLSASKAKLFRLVDRKSLQDVLEELELQLSGLADEKAAARAGEILGAEVLVSGTLYRKGDRYELFARLIRVSSAEVLAVTRARIDSKLGL